MEGIDVYGERERVKRFAYIYILQLFFVGLLLPVLHKRLLAVHT